MFAALNSFLTRLGKITDPYWAYVSMLLHGDGVNGGQNNTFLDGSTNNFTVTRNGNTTQGSFNPFTPVYPYSVATNGGSAYFDGTGDYLSTPNNAAFSFGTGDFTIEMWVYTSNLAAYQTLIDTRIVDTTSAYGFFIDNAGKPAWYDASGFQTSSTALTSNTWTHVAVVRTSGVLKIFQAGVQVYSAANTNAQTPLGSIVVGRNVASTVFYTGYISNLRVVNGTAIYTTAFTPPTAPLTAVTNTALLLGMSNGAIYDNAELNNLETVASAQISTSVFKYGTGSMSFNGTTDYLNTSPANQNSFAFGSGDFTIEMWVNPTVLGAANKFLYDGRLSVDGAFPSIYVNASSLVLYLANGATQITGGAISTATWTHIAVCRSGTSTKLFISGTQSGSTYTDTTVYLNNPLRPVIGSNGPIGAYWNGYIDDLRVTKGIARYTTTFTPPTAAFPNQGP